MPTPQGRFSASFKVSALNPITNIYVFGSTGTGTGTAPFAMNNLVSQTTYAGDELSTSKDFTLTVNDVSGKQWYAIAAVSSDNKQAFTNPIWVNGPDVTTPVTITDLHAIITSPDVPVAGRVLEQPPTAVLTTTPWCGFRLADWELVKGEFGSVAENNVEYVFTLTFHAPKGYVFDPALSTAGNFGRKVSEDGARLIYRAIYTTEPPTTTVAGCPAGWVRGPVTLDFTAQPAPEGADVAYTEYSVDGGAWVKGTSVTIKRQGVTVVSYRSTDTRDNVEQAKTCTVRIDRVAPAVCGYGRPMARQGRLLRCRYKVTDALSAKVTAKLVVKRVHSKKSRSYDLGVQRTGRRLVTGVNCDLGAGTWVWRVKARDQAGNVGYGAVASPGGLPPVGPGMAHRLRAREGAARKGRPLFFRARRGRPADGRLNYPSTSPRGRTAPAPRAVRTCTNADPIGTPAFELRGMPEPVPSIWS